MGGGATRASAAPFAFAREPEGEPDWLRVCLPACPPARLGQDEGWQSLALSAA